MFTDKDKQLIKRKGIEESQIEDQLMRFKNGFLPAPLLAPATVENGILLLSKEEVDHYTSNYDESELEVMKFVPASGAATRMFKPLFSFLQKFDGTKESFDTYCQEHKKTKKFFENLNRFAFYEELNESFTQTHGISVDQALNDYKHDDVISHLLYNEGLNYGSLPKGLLKFHKYDTESRTPAEEHLVEGVTYAKGKNGVKIHFTISPDHQAKFEDHIIAKSAEKNIDVSFSFQQADTDTIAATPECEPFRADDGSLLFRPAGHGALLENLNALNADVIFVKNIDNVVPDRLKEETIKYKKVLAGVLLAYQERVFNLLKKADSGDDVTSEAKSLLSELGMKGGYSNSETVRLLNRPIRVCGMVKNEGEPGGGPFWVKKQDAQTLQIVESAQVDTSSDEQREIFEAGTHFNPVDLVLGVKNYKGEKFDLMQFRDDEAGFISEKSYNGQKLLAMELPGLWNGSMADWNTVFVEVPLITFNPVKTVTDLLKENHC
ncbi:DUF4301 family protein [Ekhidna lutea]|nr:DUF4301 family protein [Ekhidna lutea]